jgi:predicted enzyme related to lactoylglutathione lyase
MAGNVKAVPEGTHTITPHLSVRKAPKAIEFYQKAFGAQVLGVHKTPDGKVMHATRSTLSPPRGRGLEIRSSTSVGGLISG